MPVSAPDVTKALFGGTFDVDGSGHYPGLELINLIVCCTEGVLPQTEKVHVIRAAHDFARQLITDVLPAERRSAVLLDAHTEHAVAHLLRCLELEVPNIVKSKGWERTHFFPYSRSLVHWDARKGRQDGVDVQLERRYLRGAGAYAFKVLRKDQNSVRLQATRDGFEALYHCERWERSTSLLRLIRESSNLRFAKILGTNFTVMACATLLAIVRCLQCSAFVRS